MARSGFPRREDRERKRSELNMPALEEAVLAAYRAHESNPSAANLTARDTANAALAVAKQQYETWAASAVSVEEAEAAVVQVGARIASRAERIAGITADEARRAYEERLATATAAHAALQERSDALALELNLSRLKEQRDLADRAWSDARGAPDNEAARAAVDRANAALDDARSRLIAYHAEIGLGAAADELRRVTAGTDETTRSHLRALAHGYTQALAEIRPLGGEMTFDRQSDQAAVTTVQEAAALFPSDWIDASNRNAPPRVRTSSRRAHYSDSKTIKVKRRVPLTENWEIHSDDPYEEIGASPLNTKIVPHPERSKWPGGGQRMFLVQRYDVYDPWKHRTSRDGKPAGGGWEPVTYTNSLGEDVTTWRRAQYKMETVSERAAPELLTDNGYSPIGAPGGATATHELAHRMEACVPAIGQMETAFYQRRTTRPDGSAKPLRPIYGSTGEQGRDGGFTDAYIGRDYGSKTHYEVLSVGTEALFHGEQGGLIGLGKTNSPDLDHRAFVLGVFATAR